MPFGLSKASVLGAAGSGGGATEWTTLATILVPANSTYTQFGFTSIDTIPSYYNTLAITVFSTEYANSSANWLEVKYADSNGSFTESNFNTQSHFIGAGNSITEYQYNTWDVAGGNAYGGMSGYDRPGASIYYFANWQDSSYGKGAQVQNFNYSSGKTSLASTASNQTQQGTEIIIKPEGNNAGGFKTGSFAMLAGIP